MTLFAVVLSEQEAPIVTFVVAEHGTVTGNELSVTVPGLVEGGSLNLSVMRRLYVAWSWPV
jgi:hypothetical protein